MRRDFAKVRFSPRPKRGSAVRKYTMAASMTYIENSAGRPETRDLEGEFSVEFENSDRAAFSYNHLYEFLPRPFRIDPTVTLPVGGYDFQRVRGAYTFGTQRGLSGGFSVEHGTFYNGHRTTIGATQGRVELSPRFSVQPTLSLNWVDLPQGSFTSHLVGTRVTYTMTPLMFVSALLQYNATGHGVASNVRLRWEYAPGSELFVVYNEQRDTRAHGFPSIANRALIVKINRLFRM